MSKRTQQLTLPDGYTLLRDQSGHYVVLREDGEPLRGENGIPIHVSFSPGSGRTRKTEMARIRKAVALLDKGREVERAGSDPADPAYPPVEERLRVPPSPPRVNPLGGPVPFKEAPEPVRPKRPEPLRPRLDKGLPITVEDLDVIARMVAAHIAFKGYLDDERMRYCR